GKDDPGLAVAGATALQPEERGRLDQVAELGVAVGARVKVWALVGDDVAHGCQRSPAVIVGGRLYRVPQQTHQRGVPLELGGGGARRGLGQLVCAGGGAVGIGEVLYIEVLYIDEFV